MTKIDNAEVRSLQFWVNQHQVTIETAYTATEATAARSDLRATEAKIAEIQACPSCQRSGDTLHPNHFASWGCKSGRSNHCTCDSCF